jgi:hypothetical protein
VEKLSFFMVFSKQYPDTSSPQGPHPAKIGYGYVAWVTPGSRSNPNPILQLQSEKSFNGNGREQQENKAGFEIHEKNRIMSENPRFHHTFYNSRGYDPDSDSGLKKKREALVAFIRYAVIEISGYCLINL